MRALLIRPPLIRPSAQPPEQTAYKTSRAMVREVDRPTVWRHFFIIVLVVGGISLTCTRCAQDTTQIGIGPQGDLSIASEVLNLGSVYANQTATGRIVLRSTGEKTVRYTSRFSEPAEGFILFDSEGMLPLGSEEELVITYSSSIVGQAQSQLEFIPDGDDTRAVQLRLQVETRPSPDCEDGNGCTLDTFDLVTERCTHEARPFTCNDFNNCTQRDICTDGICLGEGVSCDDNNICTDDFCSLTEGCVNTLRADCNDNNPCTEDTCDPESGCVNIRLSPGTPCQLPDAEQCIALSACDEFGACTLFEPDLDGTECDDGDICTVQDVCEGGQCGRPTPPGQISFQTEIDPLAPGSEENPLIGSEGDIYIGVEEGVQAIGPCGTLTWTSTIGTPNFAAAILLPDRLSVPVQGELFELDPGRGETIIRHSPASILPSDSDASPSTILITDMATRASGALVMGVERYHPSTGNLEGFIVELDASHQNLILMTQLGSRSVRRMAIDQDESIVLALGQAPYSREAPDNHQLIRLGVSGTIEGSWSTGFIEANQNDLAINAAGEVLWTIGLIRLSRTGDLDVLTPPPTNPLLRTRGSPVIFGPWVWNQELENEGPAGFLTARTNSGAADLSIPIAAIAPSTSPAVDQQANIFVLDQNAILHAYNPDGEPLFETALENPVPATVGRGSIAISPTSTIIIALGRTVYGIKGYAPLANAPWPKHRRDNFGTGHQ